ncbi:MAG: squalene--hopene cyclase [Bryobacterales bacterium]|nr:squalene--hopene cyclase [Bryobacterales bacterium]
MSLTLDLQEARESGLRAAIGRSADVLLSLQRSDGYWRGELTADATLEADYILLLLWMYPPSAGVWDPPVRDRMDRAAKSILDRQLPDGGFNIYTHGPSEISATVKAYCALKLAGLPADDPRLARARERILAMGGLDAANTYVKINLSLFGLYPREQVPSIPPELILLGNLVYQMSAWTRAIVIPLSIVHAADPRKPVPEGFTLEELFAPGPGTPAASGWRRAFLTFDKALKLWEKMGPRAVRRAAIRRAEQWMLDRFAGSDGLGAIYPPMMYSIMALDVLGYAPDHPVRAEAVRHFESLLVDDGHAFYFEPCFSPVWDTAIGGYALGEAGAAPEAALRRAADWLLANEVRTRGDWSVKRPRVEPSGWAFEFRNPFYPDIDDTAMVLLAFRHLRASDRAAQRECERRATQWLLAMQSKDGGWAAFDADNNWEFLTKVPFADHNAMLDPTCADITGRVLEALAAQGLDRSHPAVRQGTRFLVQSQCADGSWYGRWGVAYLYGTCFALRGLRAAGEDPNEAHMLRATEWLRSIQNADGGWGENCASYDCGVFTAAPSTASQTAWAVLGLLAGGDTTSESVRKGVEFLIRTQRPDGSWHEDLSTGTGFPRVFYLTYHYYRLYFPLLALAEYQRVSEGGLADRL